MAAQVAQSPASPASTEGESGVAVQKHTVFSTTATSDPEHGSGSSGHEPPPSDLEQPNTREATAKARRMDPKDARGLPLSHGKTGTSGCCSRCAEGQTTVFSAALSAQKATSIRPTRGPGSEQRIHPRPT